MLNGLHGNKTHHGSYKQDRTIESSKYEKKGANKKAFLIFHTFVMD